MIIKKAEYIISCASKAQYPSGNYPEFVFMGRSNVGKSSLINALTNRKNLAYTSSKPGKTLTLNFYDINDEIYFIDVPGYGYAAKGKDNRLNFGSMIEEYLHTSLKLKTCFLILDIRHTPSEDDVLMYNYLLHYDVPIKIILTRYDKLPKTKAMGFVNAVCKKLNITSKEDYFVCSSTSKYGIDKIQDYIETLSKE